MVAKHYDGSKTRWQGLWNTLFSCGKFRGDLQKSCITAARVNYYVAVFLVWQGFGGIALNAARRRKMQMNAKERECKNNGISQLLIFGPPDFVADLVGFFSSFLRENLSEKFIGHAKTQTHLKLQNSMAQFYSNCCLPWHLCLSAYLNSASGVSNVIREQALRTSREQKVRFNTKRWQNKRGYQTEHRPSSFHPHACQTRNTIGNSGREATCLKCYMRRMLPKIANDEISKFVTNKCFHCGWGQVLVWFEQWTLGLPFQLQGANPNYIIFLLSPLFLWILSFRSPDVLSNLFLIVILFCRCLPPLPDHTFVFWHLKSWFIQIWDWFAVLLVSSCFSTFPPSLCFLGVSLS